MSPVDYARTRVALENRQKKAHALVAAMRRLGVTDAGIAVGGGQRRTVWREAGLDRSPSEDTWLVVHELLAHEPVPAPAPATATPRSQRCNHPSCGAETHLYPSGWWCDPHSPWGRRGQTASDPNRVPGQPCELTRLRQARGITAPRTRRPR